MNKQEVFHAVEQKYNELDWHARKSMRIYVFINITLIIFTTALIVLNLYMVRMNPGTRSVRWVFICIAISSTIASCVSSFLTLRVYRKRSKTKRIQHAKLTDEWKLFENKEGDYSENDREEKLLKNVHDILRRE